MPSYQADRFVSISYGSNWTLECGFTDLPDTSGYRFHRWVAEITDDSGAGGAVTLTVEGDEVISVADPILMGTYGGIATVTTPLTTGDVDVTAVLTVVGAGEGSNIYMGDGDIETPPFTLWYVCDGGTTRLRQRQSRIRTPSRIRPPDLRQRQNSD